SRPRRSGRSGNSNRALTRTRSWTSRARWTGRSRRWSSTGAKRGTSPTRAPGTPFARWRITAGRRRASRPPRRSSSAGGLADRHLVHVAVERGDLWVCLKEVDHRVEVEARISLIQGVVERGQHLVVLRSVERDPKIGPVVAWRWLDAEQTEPLG